MSYLCNYESSRELEAAASLGYSGLINDVRTGNTFSDNRTFDTIAGVRSTLICGSASASWCLARWFSCSSDRISLRSRNSGRESDCQIARVLHFHSLRMCAHRSLQPTHFKPHLICVPFCTAISKPRVTIASFVAPPKLRHRLPPQKTPQWDWLTPLSLPSPKTTSSTAIQRGTSQGANHFRHRRTLTEDTPNPRGRFYSISGLQCRRSTLASLDSPSPIRRSQRPPSPGKSPLLFSPIP
jgi:hypothetical protein